MFLNNYSTYSKSSPEKSGGLNMKHKQVRHVLEHFDMFHECTKNFDAIFGEKFFICNQESDASS